MPRGSSAEPVSGTRAPRLYSPAVLALATRLADHPLDPALTRRAEERSRTCGSVVTLGVAVDGAGHVERLGLSVSACAIGQASAAVLAGAATGRTPAQILAVHDALAAWLAGEGDLPDWPDLPLLAPARDHPGRHGALLLPWKAACKALSTCGTAG